MYLMLVGLFRGRRLHSATTKCLCLSLQLFWFSTFSAENVGQSALSTVLSVVRVSHKNTSTADINRAFSSQSSDLAVVINFVVFQCSKLDLDMLVLDFLWGGVVLLLSLLTTTSQTEHKMKSGFLLDVVVTQGTPIFQLLASEDQSLLIRRNSFLILNFSFHIFDCIGSFNL